MQHQDTIAAIATPMGRGGIGVVRVSGPLSQQIAKVVLNQKIVTRHASFHTFHGIDKTVIDQGIALFFQAPASFTGEDILELQGHGGPVVMDMLLQTVLAQGARLARPGEFSERAFINNKIDLAQAEAIADLIDSHSQQAARSAIRSLQGKFSKRIKKLVQELISLRSYVEAAIDFVDEDIDFLEDGRVSERLNDIHAAITVAQSQAQQGVLLRDGLNVVIAGPPNAGKSSLLNFLAGKDTAIVTEFAGTTRDVLRESINIEGLPLHIIDTAGLRNSEDPIEVIGVKRAREEISKADMILLVFDDSQYDVALEKEILADFPTNIKVIIIRNKIDLSGVGVQRNNNRSQAEVFISLKEGHGVELLIEQLKECAGFHPGSEDAFIARRRHLEALRQAADHLNNGCEQLLNDKASELLAEDLRLAQQSLSEITGEFSSDDLLGSIFSTFCIGK